MSSQLLERIEAKTFKAEDGCWYWEGAINSPPYGRISVNGEQQQAHRVVYELFVGPIPKDHDVAHLCQTKSCVNPRHLMAMTRSDHARMDHEFRKPVCPTCGNDYTYRDHDGRRQCRPCMTIKQKEYRSRVK